MTVNRGGSPTKRCEEDGCGRLVRARGRCGGHYDAHRRALGLTISVQRVPVACHYCGTVKVKRKHQQGRYDGAYCDERCKGLHRWTQAREIVGPVPRRIWPALPIPPSHPACVRRRPPRRFYAGSCLWCQAPFVDTMPQARFCSKDHGRRWQARATKRRRGRHGISAATRAFVYARDGGVCQLCHREVDMTLGYSHPWGPTLDHIVCVSWTADPDHSPSNLRLAHRLCNSERGDAGGPPDLIDAMELDDLEALEQGAA